MGYPRQIRLLRIGLLSTALLLANVVMFGAIGASAFAASDPNQMLKGSYGFYVSGAQEFLDSALYTEVGVFTADGKGGLSGSFFQQAFYGPGCLFCPANTSSRTTVSGSYSMNADGTGTLSDFNLGTWAVVLDSQGIELKMERLPGPFPGDSTFATGRAVKQDPGFVAALASGTQVMATVPYQCTGVNVWFPTPLNPRGTAFSVLGLNHLKGTNLTGSQIVTGNGFILTFSYISSTTYESDGTFQSGDTIGVVTRRNSDSFSMFTDPFNVGYCINTVQ